MSESSRSTGIPIPWWAERVADSLGAGPHVVVSGISVSGNIHAGNLLLPSRPAHQQQQHARPSWADFGVAGLCADQEGQALELQECREMLVDERRRLSPRPRLHGKATVIRPRLSPRHGIACMALRTHLAVTHRLCRPASACCLGGSAHGITGSQGRPMQTCSTPDYYLRCFSHPWLRGNRLRTLQNPLWSSCTPCCSFRCSQARGRR